jgi:hypothetical protein
MRINTHTIQVRSHLFLATAMLFSLITVSLGTSGAGQGTINKARTQCISVEQEIIDFESLEKQVRETKAMGAIAKIKLSNDINKLLAELKAFHAGKSSLTLEQQREQYDLLYMKIVTLVQEKDPELYNQLCNAWDPIWAELQDEKNLQTVSREHAVVNRIIAGMTGVLTAIITTSIPTANGEEQLSHDDVVKNDLFIVITLHGAQCEEVIDYEKIADQDYVAICKNGNRYRVHVSAEGQVNMVPQEK